VEILGWRAMFLLLDLFAFILLSKKQFPNNKPVFNGSYGQLIGSLYFKGTTFTS
jgi:hypothetical protein